MNEITGKGILRQQDGTVYDGEFKNGVRDGFGINKYLDGGYYEG